MEHMHFLDPSHVRRSLKQLKSAKPAAFGIPFHGCILNPTLAESVVRQFETDHRVALPPDYRHFLTQIGNGGAGPYYGVFPLGLMDGNSSDLEQWHENDGLIGELSEPFLPTEAWNDLTSEPDSELSGRNPEEYERQLEAFDRV